MKKTITLLTGALAMGIAVGISSNFIDIANLYADSSNNKTMDAIQFTVYNNKSEILNKQEGTIAYVKGEGLISFDKSEEIPVTENNNTVETNCNCNGKPKLIALHTNIFKNNNDFDVRNIHIAQGETQTSIKAKIKKELDTINSTGCDVYIAGFSVGATRAIQYGLTTVNQETNAPLFSGIIYINQSNIAPFLQKITQPLNVPVYILHDRILEGGGTLARWLQMKNIEYKFPTLGDTTRDNNEHRDFDRSHPEYSDQISDVKDFLNSHKKQCSQ